MSALLLVWNISAFLSRGKNRLGRQSLGCLRTEGMAASHQELSLPMSSVPAPACSASAQAVSADPGIPTFGSRIPAQHGAPCDHELRQPVPHPCAAVAARWVAGALGSWDEVCTCVQCIEMQNSRPRCSVTCIHSGSVTSHPAGWGTSSKVAIVPFCPRTA